MSCYLIWDLDTVTRSLYARAMTTTSLNNGANGRFIVPVLDTFEIWAAWDEMVENNLAKVLQLFPDLYESEFKCLYMKTSESEYFRKWIFPDYKANRKQKGNILDRLFHAYVTDSMESIVKGSNHYHETNDRFAYNEWGLEADDHISIAATKLQDKGHTVFIMTTDKDLNIVADCIDPMTCNYKEMDRSKIWKLMLGGDAADNVPNVPRYGEKTVDKALEGKTYEEQEQIVRDVFDKHGIDFEEKFDVLKPVEYKEFSKDKNGVIKLSLLSGEVILGDENNSGYNPIVKEQEQE